MIHVALSFPSEFRSAFHPRQKLTSSIDTLISKGNLSAVTFLSVFYNLIVEKQAGISLF
ncbi:hypothetical protein QW060_19575 [Myroides ceti]|uniref:Uncharacterized protein n=1 Tax=Paenimyroides ceti TaxID=395087 RepID=A0ABT8D054_9FLAO|nr:hypothetical protein [Paenimyroides ceti]MDN3709227.1 hypothetical protein [Paenimyroides ceti]